MKAGRRVLVISDTFLPVIFGEGVHHYRVVKDALPSDCRIVNALFEFPNVAGANRVKLLLESNEWEEVENNQPYPEIDMMFSTIHKDKPEWPEEGDAQCP